MKYNDRELILELTASWQGERFDDGRPRVSDALLERLSRLTTEEAYVAMVEQGYKLQFEGDLKRLHDNVRLIGRAVTAVMVPSRPDVHSALLAHGRQQEGRTGFFNQWVIETMTRGDVLVTDMYDQVLYGTFIGGNLATAIRKRTQTGGAVIWGGIRDLEQLREMRDFQVYYRGVHPSPIGDVMMTGMNVPARIGRAVCLPGDVVLGTASGVIFIPPHLAESVACRAEKSHVRDIFGFERLHEGVYTSDQIDQKWWSAEIMEDFLRWLSSSDKALPYRHLNWETEIKNSRSPAAMQPFDGVVEYSYH